MGDLERFGLQLRNHGIVHRVDVDGLLVRELLDVVSVRARLVRVVVERSMCLALGGAGQSERMVDALVDDVKDARGRHILL